MEISQGSFVPLATIVRLAVHSDDCARLIATAGLLVGQPLALVGPQGELLGYTPEGADGHRAVAVARAAARNRLVGATGWTIVPIVRGSTRSGFLAIGARREVGVETQALLDVLPALIADQLYRVGLQRAHREAFVRRLVSDPRFRVQDARAEAGELGLVLADAYWPAILTWHRVAPPVAVVESLARDARSRADGALIALFEGRMVLLYPSHLPEADAEGAHVWLSEIVEEALALAPSFKAQAIARDAPVELARLSAEVAELDVLRRFGARADETQPVVSSRHYALERLLWADVDAAAARRFVDDQLGRLIAWDGERQTDLLSILEAALDFPRHDQAAHRCFMHRNTFRHRLQQAEKVLGPSLDDPDVRLAVHVALKLRRLLDAATVVQDGATERAGASSGSGRRSRRAGGRSSGRVARPLGRHV